MNDCSANKARFLNNYPGNIQKNFFVVTSSGQNKLEWQFFIPSVTLYLDGMSIQTVVDIIVILFRSSNTSFAATSTTASTAAGANVLKLFSSVKLECF